MHSRRRYEHLAPVTNAGIHLTEHAADRTCERVISADALLLAMDYGREVQVRGATVYAIGRKEVAAAARRGVALRRVEGLQVVVANDGSILTAYWNRNFDKLRTDGRKYRGAA